MSLEPTTAFNYDVKARRPTGILLQLRSSFMDSLTRTSDVNLSSSVRALAICLLQNDSLAKVFVVIDSRSERRTSFDWSELFALFWYFLNKHEMSAARNSYFFSIYKWFHVKSIDSISVCIVLTWCCFQRNQTKAHLLGFFDISFV